MLSAIEEPEPARGQVSFMHTHHGNRQHTVAFTAKAVTYTGKHELKSILNSIAGLLVTLRVFHFSGSHFPYL